MKTIVPIAAGPFATESDAYRWMLKNWNLHLWHHSMLRRTNRGWYILDRNHNVVHVGSKKWRRQAKLYWDKVEQQEVERLECDDCGRVDGTHDYEVEH